MLKFILMSIISFVADIAAFILVPIAILFVDSQGRLPKVFAWLETPDALGFKAGYYEPPVAAVYDKYGDKIGLMYWLMRNRAYGLAKLFKATPNFETMQLVSAGCDVPPKWGFWKWVGDVYDNNKHWFDYHYGVSLGRFYVYIRLGWKLKPLFKGERPIDPERTAIGLFTGVTLRTDDWDDFPEDQRPK